MRKKCVSSKIFTEKKIIILPSQQHPNGQKVKKHVCGTSERRKQT